MAKNFLKAGILKARAMHEEDMRGFFEGGYVSNAETKKPTAYDLATMRLQQKGPMDRNIPRLDTSLLEKQKNSSLVRRRRETNEDTRSLLDKAYGEIRNQNQLLRDRG